MGNFCCVGRGGSGANAAGGGPTPAAAAAAADATGCNGGGRSGTGTTGGTDSGRSKRGAPTSPVVPDDLTGDPSTAIAGTGLCQRADLRAHSGDGSQCLKVQQAQPIDCRERFCEGNFTCSRRALPPTKLFKCADHSGATVTSNNQLAKRCSYSETKIVELFEKYKDPDTDLIGAEGIYQLCEDLEMAADDFRILVLAWKCQAAHMCQFTRSEFIQGLCSLYADSVPSLVAALGRVSAKLRPLAADDHDYHSLYKWAFTFALDDGMSASYYEGSGHQQQQQPHLQRRSSASSVQFQQQQQQQKPPLQQQQQHSAQKRHLPLDMAIQLWRVVFQPQRVALVDCWLDFLQANADTVSTISRDTWNLFLVLVRRCAHDLSTYDEADAWPSLFDDFVHFHNDQTNQNCAKNNSPWEEPANGNVISSP